ncbi:MAG: GNAT family N-acetyltransferase [Rikenellaceae bacterium]
MINRVRITSESDERFKFCWDLYISAFPEEERRLKEYHAETMQRDIFHFDIVLDDRMPIGIVAWWDFDEWRFIEHFATSSAVRGKGYGAQILTQFAQEAQKPIILEVEHPTEEICRRRIRFYQRLGFILNEYHYQHPSYQQIEGQIVSLMIMSHPTPTSEAELQYFTEKYIPIIHFRNFNTK